jgi:hypothetical protein
MTIRYLDPEEREAEKHLDEILKYIDPISVVNTTVVFLASLQFGAGWWKAILISLAIWVMTRMHYGRRLLTKASILLLIATLVSWSGALDWLHPAAAACFR